MIRNLGFIFTLLAQILVLSLNTAVDPTWIINPLIQSGTKIIVQGNAYTQTSRYGPYLVNYSPAFTRSPWTALGLISMVSQNPNPTEIKFKININDFQNTNQMKIMMVYANVMDLRTFKVSYIAVDAAVTYLKVNYLERTSLVNVSATSGPRQFVGMHNLSFTADTSHEISVIPLLIGVNASASDTRYIMNWTSTLESSTQIYFELKVDGNTRVTQLISYFLIFDRTAAQSTQQIFLDEIYLTLIHGISTPLQLISSDPSNFHAGINSFLIGIFSFEFDQIALSINSPAEYLNFSAWNFRKRSCPSTQAFYEVNTNQCYDVCPDGSVGVDVNSVKYCRSCAETLSKCIQCATTSVCTACQSPWIVGASNLCVCPAGKYINNNGQCVDCHVNCTECLTVDTSCTKCDQTIRTLVSSTCQCKFGYDVFGQCNNECSYACIACPNDVQVCQSCQNTFELVSGRCKCADHMYLNASEEACRTCHNLCVLCTGPTQNQCATCDSSLNRVFNNITTSCPCNSPIYEETNGVCVRVVVPNQPCPEGYINNGSCVQICGDGKLFELECDDGNLVDGDGCDSTCKIQDLYKCLPGSPTQRSICSFDGFLIFSLIQGKKDVHSNRLFLKYQITPKLLFLQQYQDFIPFLAYNFDYVKINLATYDKATQVLSVEITYSENLHQRQLQLTFTPPASSDTFAVRVSRKIWIVAPTNNLAALKYDDLTYESVRIADYIATAAYIAALLLACISLFFRKVIGLQLISMFQISFLSLSLLDFAQPLLGVITSWQFIFGYNQLHFSQPQDLPQYSKFQLLHYKTLFGFSVNAMLIANAAVYLGSLLCLSISYCTSKSTSRKFKQVSKFFPRQIAFGLIFFQTMNILIAIGIEVYYENFLNFEQIWSKIFQIVAVVFLIGHFFGFLCTYESNIDSHSFYKKDSKFSKLHPMILFLRNGLIAAWLFLTIFVKQALYVVMAVQGCYIVLMIFMRPYKKIIDFIRVISIEVGIAFIIVSRFIQSTYIDVQVTNDEWGKFYNYSAYIQYGFFMIALVMSTVALIYHIFRIAKNKQRTVNPDDVNESDLSDLENELKNEGNTNQQEKSKQMLNNNSVFFGVGQEFEDFTYHNSKQLMVNESRRKMKRRQQYF